MSGHSKWATIKHKKGAADARRGKVFTKLIKEITVAARISGGDADSNPRLRTAIGTTYEEVTFEGYGPGGVAMMLEVATDNRNRTLSEIRHIFSKNGGNLGEHGCVSWMFGKKGYVVVGKENTDEETLLNLITEAGAEDMRDDGSQWEIITSPEAFHQVVEKLKAAHVAPQTAEIAMVPQSNVKVSGKGAQQMLRLMEELEDHDDVQHVYANFEIEEAELHALAQAK
ncbi:MAG: YebC/PmpR family DNA-binding transcriptional regulator [Acidobacteriia bacterium]|nr:YebC/PmpR family DNA-binding transcriptional regulator [Terriglobia bacterium]